MRRNFLFMLMLTIPVFVFAQDAGKKKAYYFYGDKCPHCKVVDAYFQENGVYDKYEITKLEVASNGNPFNQKLFLDFGKAFGSSEWGGVPTVVFADKYLIGDEPIIEDFEKEIDRSDKAGELPDPEKIQKTGSGGESGESNQNQDAQKNALVNEKKNNYIPFVFIGIILAGVGALVYVNRK